MFEPEGSCPFPRALGHLQPQNTGTETRLDSFKNSKIRQKLTHVHHQNADFSIAQLFRKSQKYNLNQPSSADLDGLDLTITHEILNSLGISKLHTSPQPKSKILSRSTCEHDLLWVLIYSNPSPTGNVTLNGSSSTFAILTPFLYPLSFQSSAFPSLFASPGKIQVPRAAEGSVEQLKQRWQQFYHLFLLLPINSLCTIQSFPEGSNFNARPQSFSGGVLRQNSAAVTLTTL